MNEIFYTNCCFEQVIKYIFVSNNQFKSLIGAISTIILFNSAIGYSLY